VFLAKLFLVVSLHAHAHLLLDGEHSLWESLGWQNFPTKILQFTSLLRATQTAGENIAVLQRSSYQLADKLQGG